MQTQNNLKFLTNSFEFSNITILILIFHALTSALGYLILGPSPYINGSALLLIIVMDTAICMALRYKSASNGAHILILAWFVILYFCVRLTAYLFFPPSTLEFLVRDGLNGEEISSGLVFVVGGVIALLMGIFAGDRIAGGNRLPASIKVTQFSLWSITGYWIATYIAAYYVRVHLGVTIFAAPEHWGNRMAWVGIILDTDVALILTICWATFQWRNTRLTKYQMAHVILLVFIWLAFSVWVGSRGGPLRILNCIFLIALATNPNFKLSIARFGMLIVGFFVMNYLVFALGTIFRGYHLQGGGLEGAVKNYQAKIEETFVAVKPLKVEVSELRGKFYDSESLINVAMALQRTVTRLGVLDYALVIISKDADKSVIDYYIKSFHPIKNFMNNMVPGEIFEESTVNTSRVFGMAYRGTTLEAINQGFSSEPWTLWGMAWIFANFFGLGLMFLVALVMQVGLGFCRIFSGHAIFARAVYFIIMINIGYIMFGIDHWLTALAHFSLSCFIAYFIIYLFEMFRKRMPRPVE